MEYKVIMIFGDFLTVMLVCFYGGVGILDSGTASHMLKMILPCMAFWAIFSPLFRVYAPVSEIVRAVECPTEGNVWNHFVQRAEVLQRAERTIPLAFAWGITAVLSAFWQSFYWQRILKSDWYYRVSPGLLLWYCSASFMFLLAWRGLWSLMVLGIRACKTHPHFRILTLVGFGCAFLWLLVLLGLTLHLQGSQYRVETCPDDIPRTALVFGAGVYRNGTASRVLADRVDTAVQLYLDGKIDRMILSGDNRDISRNEVDVMEERALQQGVPAEAILRDEEGYSTRESLHHAAETFGLTAVTLVTQRFHSMRTQVLSQRLGLQTVFVSADRSMYNHFSWIIWYIRDRVGIFLTLVGLYN